jgi:type I restriction-modification system DNA methylase subunit
MSKIEQFTEDLTKKLMGFEIGDNTFGYVYPQGNVFDITKISDLLSKAGGKPKDCSLNDYSISGTGKAKPEFIITFRDEPNTIIIIECKKQSNKHKSENFDKPNGYALDGVLYYAKYLKKEYNVLAIGVSGTEKEKAKLDVYYWAKLQDEPIYQKKLHNIFLTPDNYLKAIRNEKITKSYSLDEIRETAIQFHDQLRSIKVTERQKPIFIAGILIALEDKDFARDYVNMTSFNLVMNALTDAIERVLDDSDISKSKKSSIKTSFKSISNNEKLKQIPIGNDNSIVWYIEQLEMKIKPMMNNADSSLDALGVFYHEFVKYSGGDGSGLGIVLTPQHLTEFMCELAEIDENSYVADICCGSGSFLVSAMNQMFKKTSDVRKFENIRKHQLHGIELDSDLYVLSIANMIIRRDGKSNIIHGDCFDKKTIETLQAAAKLRIDKNGKELPDNMGIDVGLLNPPYSQKDIVELEFVEQLLSIIIKGGKAVVVVPMSCAIGTKYKDVRERLFKKHTLKAVFSMPDDIFYPTGTNVCVMVWEAHKPHDIKTKTYFGYYKEDGFVKRKKLGRVDIYEKWDEIKAKWLQHYRDYDVIDGLSAKHNVTDNDEWLAEAYMQTDYSKINDEMFETKVREYLSYLIAYGINDLKNINEKISYSLNLNNRKWVNFKLSDLFTPARGTRLTKEDRILGNIPLVTAGEGNLGVKALISNEEQEKYCNRITIDMFCNSYVHVNTFCCDDNIITLNPKYDISKYTMIFISAIIELDKYRYQYGRQYRMKNFEKHTLKLPLGNQKMPDWEFMEDYIKSLPYSEFI